VDQKVSHFCSRFALEFAHCALCKTRAFGRRIPLDLAQRLMAGHRHDLVRRCPRIQERVRAGLARAKAAGAKFGRPRIHSAKEKEIRKALQQGDIGMRKIAVEFRVGPAPCSGSERKCVARRNVAMRWRRGFSRIWLIISIGWIGFVSWVGYQRLSQLSCFDTRRANPSMGNPY
jgi:hypothetical protein